MAESYKPIYEPGDSNLASRLALDVKDEAFLKEYWEYRDIWNGCLGRPGSLPEATWLELAARQRRRLAVAESADSPVADEVEAPRGPGRPKKLQTA